MNGATNSTAQRWHRPAKTTPIHPKCHLDLSAGSVADMTATTARTGGVRAGVNPFGHRRQFRCVMAATLRLMSEATRRKCCQEKTGEHAEEQAILVVRWAVRRLSHGRPQQVPYRSSGPCLGFNWTVPSALRYHRFVRKFYRFRSPSG